MFEVVTLQEHWPRSLEQMGTKRKFWYAQHNEEEGEPFWLFKYARRGTGEDWAEKIAEYLCECLGLPHARYELAITERKEYGVVSPSFLRRGEQLILGNQLLATVDPSYAQMRTRYGNSIHSVNAVLTLLAIVDPPRSWILPEGIKTAPEVFVGYLLLDALIGNGDRHDENWGVVAETTGIQRSLALTFDHASSMGRELTDEARRQKLSTRDQGQSIATYANRGRSALYRAVGDKRTLGTVEAFTEAAIYHRAAAQYWKQSLDKLTPEIFEEGFDQIPSNRISDVAREFALTLLLHNQQRLRDVLKLER